MFLLLLFLSAWDLFQELHPELQTINSQALWGIQSICWLDHSAKVGVTDTNFGEMASKILPPLGGASAQRIRAWTPAPPRQQGQAGAESVLQRGSPRWGNTEESSGGLRLLSALIRPHTWPPCPHTPTSPFALTLLNMPPGPQSFLQDSPSPSFPPFQGSTCPLHVLGTLLTAFSPSSTPFSGGGAHVLPPCHRRSVSLGNPENSTPNPRPLCFFRFWVVSVGFSCFPMGHDPGLLSIHLNQCP